jgi:hypothetical protein
MKKKALIIQSFTDPTDQEFKSGVFQDGGGYASFLQSANGGGWILNQEIYVLTNPTAEKLRHWVAWLDDADIAQVYYSGHGFRDINFDREFVNINPYEVFGIRGLMSKAVRQITIIDACRSYYAWSHFEGLSGVGLATFDFQNLAHAREVYAHFVKKSPAGKVIIYACSVGEFSYCDADGGFFTRSFLKAASTFNQKSQLSLSVHECFKISKVLLKQFGKQQRPSALYFGSDKALNLPLVIHPKITKLNRPTMMHHAAKQTQNNKWVKPVLGAAALLFLIGLLGGE